MSKTQIAKEPKMAPEISFRPTRPDDYDFAAGLYLDSMKRHLTAPPLPIRDAAETGR